MFLADTSVWIDYLHGRQPEMEKQLADGQIVIHPMVTAELALGPLRNRRRTLAVLDMLIPVRIAQIEEVRRMIEARALYGKGIGLVDAHLLASCSLTPGTVLWTRDKALGRVAEGLGVRANLP